MKNLNISQASNALKVIALSTSDPLVKSFALQCLKQSESDAKQDLIETCWGRDIDNLRAAMTDNVEIGEKFKRLSEQNNNS